MLSCHPHKGNNGNGDDHYLLCFTHTPSAPIIRHTICNDKALYNRVENMIRLLRLFPCRFYTSLLTSIVLWSIFFACVHANSPGQPTFDKYVNRGLTIAATKTQMTRKPILSVRMASYNTYFSCQLCHTATCDRGGRVMCWRWCTNSSSRLPRQKYCFSVSLTSFPFPSDLLHIHNEFLQRIELSLFVTSTPFMPSIMREFNFLFCNTYIVHV